MLGVSLNEAVTLYRGGSLALSFEEALLVSGLCLRFTRGLDNILRSLGEHAKAIADFTKAIELWPDFAAALRNRAHSYHQLGDTAKAQADFSAALQIDPSEPERVPVQYRRQGKS